MEKSPDHQDISKAKQEQLIRQLLEKQSNDCNALIENGKRKMTSDLKELGSDINIDENGFFVSDHRIKKNHDFEAIQSEIMKRFEKIDRNNEIIQKNIVNIKIQMLLGREMVMKNINLKQMDKEF